MTDPTPQDYRNATTRASIAARQAAEYTTVLKLALGAFGPGWFPSHRHYLVSKENEEESRRTGERPKAAATVYTVKNSINRQRHFTVEEGRVIEHPSYEAGFGAKLLEPHPTRKIEVRGQLVSPHHFSLCFAPYVLYEPRSAEDLAALRDARERRKAARAEQKERAENPLFTVWAERVNAEQDDKAAER